MEHFIKFCALLLKDWHKIADEDIKQAVDRFGVSVKDVKNVFESVRSVATSIHKHEKPYYGYWKSLIVLALNIGFAISKMNHGEARVAVREGVGILIQRSSDRGFEIITNLMKKAIESGEFNQFRLFGPELYKWAKGLDNNGMLFLEGMETYREWWLGAARLVREGYRVHSVGNQLVLRQKEVVPMTERVLSSNQDIAEVARLLALVVCREKSGTTAYTQFLMDGLSCLPKDVTDSIFENDKNGSAWKYVNKELSGIAKEFSELWHGGAKEAITVLERLTGYADSDQTGMQRMLRCLARSAPDLIRIAAYSVLRFRLDALPNGTECLKIFMDGDWYVVVTEECPRLRKTVINDEAFKLATEEPSIVCQYAGKYMAVIPPLKDPSLPEGGDKNYFGKECLTKVLQHLKFMKLYTTCVYNHEKGGPAFLRHFLLPNLCLMTRADHISAELKTGRVNRTLINPSMDNILVVANVLSRAQRKNSGQLVPEAELLAKGLAWSKKPGGRITKLFPRLTKMGICLPGDLMTMAAEAFASLMNNRMPHGITSTIVGDPRLELDEVLLPECMESHVDAQGTKNILTGKMPSYVGFELTVRDYSDDGVTHVHPMLALLKNADFDGDQSMGLAKKTDTPGLRPSAQGGYFAKLSAMTNATVAIPKANLTPDYDSALKGLIYGKLLMGKFVKFWRQTFQAVVPLNPFRISYCREAFIKYNREIAAIMLEYGCNEFVSEAGEALWDKFIADYGQGDDPFDYAANQVALVFVEMVMPKSKLGKKAEAILHKMGIAPEEMRTLEGQLKVMDNVANDPIGTFQVFVAIDDKLIVRWLPRVIMAFLAMYTLCSTTGISLQEHINTAPAGRKFHGKPGDWKRGMVSIINLVKEHGLDGIAMDNLLVEPSESFAVEIIEDDEEGGNDFFNKKNNYHQPSLMAMLEDSYDALDCRISKKNGITTIPTAFAVEMLRRYLEVVDSIKLTIVKGHDDQGNEIYSLVGPGDIVYITGILRRLELKPGEELAPLHYMEDLCSECGSIYGFCQHSYCQKCGAKVGHCKHTSVSDIKTEVVNGVLAPHKALAWMLTRRGLDEKGMVVGADSVLAKLEKEMFKGYASALSAGEVFNRDMRKFARKLAYRPGKNLTPELMKWAKEAGFNLNTVAVMWSDNPTFAATLPHPADVSAASAHQRAMFLALNGGLCPTTTSSSKPGAWMRYLHGDFPAFIKLMNVAYSYVDCKKHTVAIKAEQGVAFASGFSKPAVAWEGVPTEVLPDVILPLVGFFAHPAALGDQVALTHEFLKELSVIAEKKFPVSKGHIVHVGDDMQFVLKDRGDKVGRGVLITDPTNVFTPTIVEENGLTEYCVELVGEFERVKTGYMATEDCVVILSAVLEGHTAMKLVDFNGNKGLSFKLYTEGRFVADIVGNERVLDGILSPDRFCETKMQAGASVVNAIWSQVRLVANANGTHSLDEPYRVLTSIPQEKMLDQALVALYSELVKVQNMSAELSAKLKAAYAAFSEAKTIEERVAALWPLAFVPVYYVLNGVRKYVGDQMISHHAFTVQPIFSKDNCTRPTFEKDERLVKFDRFGRACLNIAKNDSTAGAAFRQDYAGMTLQLYKELMDELYGQYEKMRGDSAKIYLFEAMMTTALQYPIIAFKELGGQVPFPAVTQWDKDDYTMEEVIDDDIDDEEDEEVED